MTLTIKLDRNWSSFQLANSAPPLSVTDSAIAPSARMHHPPGLAPPALATRSMRRFSRKTLRTHAAMAQDLRRRQESASVNDRIGLLATNSMLPQRVCCPQRCAMPAQHARVPEQAQDNISPQKNTCDKQVSSWRHISCHTDKNRYYT